ncbi:MAG: peptide chain release factor eRF subunit 1 [Candidatus Hecatellales archaeon B24]|nr:MAG: peptide chain release factor eRF subunit 1 [Candidatus Hecatellales archaeon B24]
MAQQRSRSVELFKVKRLLDTLASKRGRHTELISLYVPPGRQLSEVIGVLRQEYFTASNIKSRTTRHNVQDAIERVIQRLKLVGRTPPTGLVVFCGSIPQNGPGTERMETYVIVPPEPIDVYLYRCDSRFHVEHLFNLVREKETYGIMVIDGSGATYATLKGKRLEIVKSITSGISGKHRAGGQSARRFERLREVEVNEYFKRAGNYANQIFLEIPDLKGLIVGGPGPTKNEFLEGGYLHYELKGKVIAVVDTSYVEEQGVKEVVAKAQEILRNVRYIQERQLVQTLLREVGKENGLAAYGVDEVRKLMKAGVVEVLLLSEGLNLLEATVKCSSCGYVEKHLVKPADLVRFKGETAQRECPKCGFQGLQAKEKELIDVLMEEAEQAGVSVEMISPAHEEGEMLLKSFGGIAALLKYKV